jgi:hypothetical protein
MCAWVASDAISPSNFREFVPASAIRGLRDPTLIAGARQLSAGVSESHFYGVVGRMDRECARLKVEPH